MIQPVPEEKKKLLIKVISRKGWKWTTINLFPSAVHCVAGTSLPYCAAGIAHGHSCRACSAVSPSSWWRGLFSPCPSVFSSSVSTLSWQFQIASWMLCRFHRVLGRASSTVKTPSRILRTCVHTADDFSSRPISWTIFRRYCWVSCKQWISRRTETFLQKKQSFDTGSDFVNPDITRSYTERTGLAEDTKIQHGVIFWNTAGCSTAFQNEYFRKETNRSRRLM